VLVLGLVAGLLRPRLSF